MPNFENYAADPHDFQQLVPWSPTGYADCSPETGAFLAAEHTGGAVRLNGQIVRLNSSERVPDPKSPGLNWRQVDPAVYKASGGKVDLYLEPQVAIHISRIRDMVEAGRTVGIQMDRGRMIARQPKLASFSDFRGGHAGAVKLHPFATPRLFDPLVPIYLPIDWDDIAYAGINLSGVPGTGYVNALSTRDVVPSSYSVLIDGGEKFSAYKVNNGKIVDHKSIGALDHSTIRKCLRKTSIWYPKFNSYRTVVQLTEGKLANTSYNYIRANSFSTHYVEHLP